MNSGHNVNAFASAMAMQPKPPCERFSCPSFARCRDNQLACDSFRLYVEKGRSLPPQMQRTGKHGGFEPGKIEPTNAIFKKIYREDDFNGA